MENSTMGSLISVIFLIATLIYGKKYRDDKENQKSKKIFYGLLICYFLSSAIAGSFMAKANLLIGGFVVLIFGVKCIYYLLKKNIDKSKTSALMSVLAFVVMVISTLNLPPSTAPSSSPTADGSRNVFSAISMKEDTKKQANEPKIEQSYFSKKISRVTGMDAAGANNLEQVLEQCNFSDVEIVHDEMLDGYKDNPKTKGYRMNEDDLSNIILYVTGNEITAIRYIDYNLYVDGKLNYTKNDFFLKNSEFSDLKFFCMQVVEKSLVSPKTADFAGYSDWHYSKTPKGIKISSYVDSQNIYGAIIRNNFTFEFTPDGKSVTAYVINGQRHTM